MEDWSRDAWYNKICNETRFYETWANDDNSVPFRYNITSVLNSLSEASSIINGPEAFRLELRENAPPILLAASRLPMNQIVNMEKDVLACFPVREFRFCDDDNTNAHNAIEQIVAEWGNTSVFDQVRFEAMRVGTQSNVALVKNRTLDAYWQTSPHENTMWRTKILFKTLAFARKDADLANVELVKDCNVEQLGDSWTTTPSLPPGFCNQYFVKILRNILPGDEIFVKP